MGQRSDLPLEILNLITTYCGRNCTQVKWMFVSERWFTFYLSQVYSTIRTSIVNSEPTVQKILNSSFEIGKYVKCVHLSDIRKPVDLYELHIHNDLLGMITQKTPNVRKVCLFQIKKDWIYKDWLYFSIVLISANCWRLQFLPDFQENYMASAHYYYLCAHYSCHTLKKLELTYEMLKSKDTSVLKEFTVLETLEVHKGVVNGLNDLESLLQFTPTTQELTVRFFTGRISQPVKKEYAARSSIKKLRLYNFTPQHDELFTLVKEFSSLENLYIFGEKEKMWLSNIDDPLTIETFFNSINSIQKYEIMIPRDTPRLGFSEPWLKSIKKNVHLLHTFKEIDSQNHLNSQTNVVATFYGGSLQSIPLLKYSA